MEAGVFCLTCSLLTQSRRAVPPQEKHRITLLSRRKCHLDEGGRAVEEDEAWL